MSDTNWLGTGDCGDVTASLCTPEPYWFPQRYVLGINPDYPLLLSGGQLVRFKDPYK